MSKILFDDTIEDMGGKLNNDTQTWEFSGENKMNKFELIGERMNESENALQNLIDARMLHLGEDKETATKAAIAYLSVLGRLTA